MDHTAGPEAEGEAQGTAESDPADFDDDLDQLAVVEAELTRAEAELEALDSSATAPPSE